MSSSSSSSRRTSSAVTTHTLHTDCTGRGNCTTMQDTGCGATECTEAKLYRVRRQLKIYLLLFVALGSSSIKMTDFPPISANACAASQRCTDSSFTHTLCNSSGPVQRSDGSTSCLVQEPRNCMIVVEGLSADVRNVHCVDMVGLAGPLTMLTCSWMCPATDDWSLDSINERDV